MRRARHPDSPRAGRGAGEALHPGWPHREDRRGEHHAIQPDDRIEVLDGESGRVTELFRKEGPLTHASLAVSPDEEWILYDEAPSDTSELMLVENFR